MNVRRTLFLLTIFLLCLLPAYGQPMLSDPGQELILQFSLFESENAPGKFLLPGDSLARFTPYVTDDLPLERDPHDRMITMVSEFAIAGDARQRDLAVFLPPIEYVARIFLNGQLIALRGDNHQGYTNRTHYSKAVLLPPSLLAPGRKANCLTVQLYPLYGETIKPFGKLYISSYETAVHEEFLRNLFGPNFSVALLAFCTIMFAYFATTHFSLHGPETRYFLYFGLLNLAGVLSQVNNAFSSDFENVLLMEKIAKAGFNMIILMHVLFINEYTGIFKKKKVLYGVLITLFVAATIMTAVLASYSAVLEYYSWQVTVLHLPMLLAIMYYLVKYARAGTNPFALPLLITYIIAIGTMFYDSQYYFNYHVKPFANLTPYGLFVVNITLVFIMAAGQRKLKDKAVESETALKVLSDGLEKLVSERTAQLDRTVAELHGEIAVRTVTQEKLDLVIKTKDKLFSIIAHDLRNVFNSTISFSEFMGKDVKDGEFGNIAKDILTLQRSSKRAYQFLENLLEWSLSELEMIAFSPSSVNLKQMADECLELFTIPLAEKRLSVDVLVAPGTLVLVDKRMMQTVLRNLISNAIKYSFDNGKIIISAEAPGDVVEITVKDFGIGISDPGELLRNDLQKSQQGTALERGSGLGLFLAKDFLERHGSSLRIESQIEKGSAFSFSAKKG